MGIFSYHLVRLPFLKAVKGLWASPVSKHTKGLVHAEYMTAMTLGAPMLSPSRFLVRQVAIFAQWEDEKALINYLEKDKFGKILATAWHTRLVFLRKWGHFSKFKLPEQQETVNNPSSTVVAVTIARMRPLQVPRFIHWGRPVEKLVRDDPGTTLSLASVKLPNTVSTFSIWKTEKEMTNMVHGHSGQPHPKRHSNAMKERERKDFHFEFTTLRFRPISEFGSWQGEKNFIPSLVENN